MTEEVYEDDRKPHEIILEDEFDFCGCGMPEKAFTYVRSAMQILADRTSGWEATNFRIGPGEDPIYKKFKADCDQLFNGSHGAEYFMWYWLDSKDYTTHGGSVPGWLTDKGQKLLARMNAIKIEG